MKKEFTISLCGTEYPAFYIDNKSDANILVEKLMQLDVLFGIDTETAALPKYKKYPSSALNPYYSDIRLLQIFTGKASLVFDLHKIGCNELFIPFLSTKKFVAHNAVFDLQYFYRMGVRNMDIGCSMLMSRLLIHAKFPEEGRASASLASMTELLFGESVLKTVQSSDWSEPELTFEQIEYAALDAVCCLKVAEHLIKGIRKHKLERVYNLYKEAQHPIVAMQLNGVYLNEDAHAQLIEEWRVDLFKYRKDVLDITKIDTITSNKIATWLEDNLDEETLCIWPRTETGKLKTDAHTLSDFSYLNIVSPFSRFQKAEKLLNSFGVKLIKLINEETGRVHSSYGLGGARTGRLVCYDPNFQQSPREKRFRANFVPQNEGYSVICADYSQIELRVAAEVSKDEVMLHAYREGKDLHRVTAAALSGVSYDAVTDLQRQQAKAFNFGLLFGIGAKKFSKYAKYAYDVEISFSVAKQSIKAFRELYSGYYAWQTEQASLGASTLEVRTVCGKLRKLDREHSFGPAINTPIQGTAGEVLLHALIRLHKHPNRHGHLIETVHDEIGMEGPTEYAEEDKTILEESMVKGFLDVFPEGITRGLVEANIGASWADAK